MITTSRYRRAKLYDALAVALLMILMAALGCVVVLASAPWAHADSAADAWEAEYGYAACSFLDDPSNTSVTGLSGVILGAEHMGLTPEQAGEAVAASVLDICPRHRDLLRQFVIKYGPRQVA